MESRRPIALIGMMGAGKTTVGELVARRLGVSFIDNDDLIAKRSGQPAADLLREDPTLFRDLEQQLIRETLEADDVLIFGTGGGAIEREETQETLRSLATVIWLRGSVDVLVDRVNGTGDRPMLDGDLNERMQALLDQREPVYERLADVTVDIDVLTPDEVATCIVEALS